jgi:GR25 family glycosyltransferase involved in LPS biosynthesis
MVMYWDKIYVINLAHRVDRIMHFHETIKQSALLSAASERGAITIFQAVSPQTWATPTWYVDKKNKERRSGYWCCRESHLRVWSDAITNRYRSVLIFEDDARIYSNFDKRLSEFHEELPKDWMGYQLGGHWDGKPEYVSANCLRMRGFAGLHCYSLSMAGLVRTYDHLLYNCQDYVDIATKKLQILEPHFYRPKHWFVSVMDDFSNNEGKVVDYGRKNTPVVGYDW